MISATILGHNGHDLSGQAIEAYFVGVEHAKSFAVSGDYALGSQLRQKS